MSRKYKTTIEYRNEISGIIEKQTNTKKLAIELEEYINNFKPQVYFNNNSLEQTIAYYLFREGQLGNRFGLLSNKDLLKKIPFIRKYQNTLPAIALAPVHWYGDDFTIDCAIDGLKNILDWGRANRENDPAILNLIEIMKKNKPIAKLLFDGFVYNKEAVLAQLIYNKKIDLKSIKALVNYGRTIYENTVYIHTLLRKKFPQTDIYNIVLDCFNGHKTKLKTKKRYEKIKLKMKEKRGIEKSP